jgi:hypothetical protein
MNEETIKSILKEILEETKPTDCVIHGQALVDMQEDINGIAKTLGQFKLDYDAKKLDDSKQHQLLAEIDHKLFRDNGEICMSNRIKDNKMEIKRHIDSHSKTESRWVIWVGIGASTLIGLGGLLIGLAQVLK